MRELPVPVSVALRAALVALREQHREVWEGSLRAFAAPLSSLGSLAEQTASLRRAEALGLLGGPPLAPFPDLPRRLAQRLRAAAEALMAQLHRQRLPELRKARDGAALRVAEAWALLEGLEAAASFRRSALSPSVADVTEWLSDIQDFYHRTYLEAKLLLLQIRYENLEEMQALPKAWEQVMQRGLQSTVDDALLKVSFFLEEAA